MFIVGDFNVDTSSAAINPNIVVNNFQNMFLSYFYTPLIDKYNREDNNRGTSTLLDNIYTNVTQTLNSGVLNKNFGSLLKSLYYRLNEEYR